MTMQRTSYRSIPAGDLPEGLVPFDGVCVLCSGWVKFTIPRDEARRFRFAAIQGGYGRSIAERLGIDPDEPGTNAVVSNGYVHFKSDSALAVLGGLPGWRWTRIFKAVPKPLRDWLYDRVARNRYALFGRHDSCLMPTPEMRGRFVDGHW